MIADAKPEDEELVRSYPAADVTVDRIAELADAVARDGSAGRDGDRI